MNINSIKTLSELKLSGYKTKPIKDELRDNLIKFLKENKNPFDGIIGFDDTVIPDLQTAVLSRHDILVSRFKRTSKNKNCQVND